MAHQNTKGYRKLIAFYNGKMSVFYRGNKININYELNKISVPAQAIGEYL